MENKQSHNRVQLPQPALVDHTTGQVLQHPAIVHPPGHHTVHAQRGGDGRALEVLALARGVLGQGADGDVEARKAREAAEDEEGQKDGVGEGAHANGEGDHGGGDAEGDLVLVSTQDSTAREKQGRENVPSRRASQAPVP